METSLRGRLFLALRHLRALKRFRNFAAVITNPLSYMDEKNIQNPYEIQLAAAAEEIGADVKIEYYKATVTFNRAQLKQIQDNGLPTDVMSLVMFALMEHGYTKDQIVDFFAGAQEHNQAPKVTFVTPEQQG